MLFDEGFDLPSVVLRYFNVYGPRQPETGAYALVLGIFLKRRAEGKPLEIHGDGRQRRDFVHVRDVVAANIAAMESSRARRSVQCRQRHEPVGQGIGRHDLASPNPYRSAQE